METNLMDYLQIFFRRKNLFFYPFMLTVFVMVVLSFVLPKTYISLAVILIEEEKVINPLISGLAVSTSVTERLRILREQILSWTSLTELVQRLKLDEHVRTSFSYEELIKHIRKNINVQLKGPQVVEISYQGRQPEKVQQVVSTLTDIFIKQNIQAQTKETDIAVKFLEDQLRFYRRKIKGNEIERLQKQLDNLLVDSTEKHPLVKDLSSRIAKLKRELGDDTTDVKILSKQPVALDKDVLSLLLYQELKKGANTGQPLVSGNLDNGALPLTSGSDVSDLPLDATVDENIYGMLLQRLETARITKELETFKEGTRFSIIDPPRLPLRPVKPSKIKFLLLGIVLGVGAGYGCIFLAEFIDRSFRNIKDAKEGLDLPVLGAISIIITEDEFNRRKQSANFAYFLLTIFFMLMIIIVVIFSFMR